LVLVAACGVVLVALAPLAADGLASRATVSTVIEATIPTVDQPWTALPNRSGDWLPHFKGADAEVAQSYTAGNHDVHLYIAYYARQKQGAELVNEDNVLIDGKNWVRLAEQQTRAVIDGRELAVHEIVSRSSQSHGRRLMWTWYWVGGEFTSNPYYAKLLQAKVLLSGEPRAAAIAVATDQDDFEIHPAHVLQDFLNHMPVATSLSRFASTQSSGAQQFQ